MGKLISWLLLGLFVVIVPLGSWFYLKKGLDYRKGALMELTAKDSIESSIDSLHLLIGKTSVIVLDSLVDADITAGIRDQFKNTPGFQVIFINGSDETKWPKDYLGSFLSKYQDSGYMLIDTAGKVRNVYDNSDEGIKKLIAHTAIVIPRPVEADIKVKNKQ
jgi:hypothetical protein